MLTDILLSFDSIEPAESFLLIVEMEEDIVDENEDCRVPGIAWVDIDRTRIMILEKVPRIEKVQLKEKIKNQQRNRIGNRI